MNASIRGSTTADFERNEVVTTRGHRRRAAKRIRRLSSRSQSGAVKITAPAAIAVVAAAIAVILGLSAIAGGGDDDAPDASTRPPVTTDPNGAADAAVDEDDPGGSGTTQQAQQERLAALARLDATDPLARGAIDAPVVMINYSDFQCQYCRRFVIDTEPALVERYVDEGLMRIEWRDFPWIGEESLRAARAARAAGAQGRFWQYNELLYGDQPDATNSGMWSDEHLIGLAGTAGMDPERFRADMNSDQMANAVAEDFTEGQQIGVTGTPTFLINGRPLVGAHPLEVFVEVIDEALTAADANR